jgi:hypothetical protein
MTLQSMVVGGRNASGGAAPTVGQVLSTQAARVDRYLSLAKAEHRVGEVVAGVVVATAVQQCIVSLADHDGEAIDQLTQSLSHTLDLVGTAVSRLVDGTINDRASASRAAAQIVTSLPVDRLVPQVSLIEPLMAIESNDALTVAVHGNFFDLAAMSRDASLKVNAKAVTLTSTDNSTTQIGFRIPMGLLQPRQGDAVAYTDATLAIPFRTGCLLGMFCKRGVATFAIVFITVPQSAGVLTFVSARQALGRQRQTVIGAEIAQESDRDDLEGVPHCWYADPGWKVDRNSVAKIVDWSQGEQGNGMDWWWTNNLSTDQAACWGLTTVHHGLGTSGKVHFRLRFEETRDVEVAVEGPPRTVSLEWGSVREFSIPQGAAWRATYDFEGRQTVITRPGSIGPYVRADMTETSVTFATVP